jgi:N-acetylglutamate synthase-like GNAT family acetyltransferase
MIDTNKGVAKAVLADAPQIADLNKQFHLDIADFRWDTVSWVKDEIKNDNYYVIRDDNGLAAALCLHQISSLRAGVIEAMAVRADLQGSGLGKVLVDHAITVSESRALRELIVESFCEYGVQGFYERCGFTRAAQTKQFRGHSYYCFSMKLRKPPLPAALRMLSRWWQNLAKREQ